MSVMSPSAQVTVLLAYFVLHEHGSRRAPLHSVHPVMLVALARSCHAAHETAFRPLLLTVQVARGFVTPHFAALVACALQVLRSVQF